MLTSTTRQSRILGMKALLKTCELGCKVPLNQRLIHIIFAARRTLNPNRSLEKASCHFLMTAIRKIALYMLDS